MGTFYDNLPYTARVIRLAQNENPYGSAPKALEAIKNNIHLINQYPIYNPQHLIERISTHLGVDHTRIAVSAGSVEMIDLAIKAFVGFDEEVAIPDVSFVAYKLLSKINGRAVVCSGMNNFTIDLSDLLGKISPKTKLVFIANPNNPTGTSLSEDQIVAFLQKVPQDVMVVLDEAYAEYVADAHYPDSIALLDQFPNLIVFKTFSKIYGLAGLRIGYAVSSPEIAQVLQGSRTPFSVNKLAETAAVAALDDTDFVEECARQNADERAFLTEHLREFSYPVYPSQANFLYLSFESTEERDGINDLLYADGIVVRKADPFGDPNGIRITIGKHNSNQKVVDILSKARR